MVSCLAAAGYTMKADVWGQVNSIDPSTNETVREWRFLKTIKCKVVPYTDGGIHGAGTGEKFDDLYTNQDYARLRSSQGLLKRQRITNIRNARTNVVLWADEESDDTPTMFNVDGSIPITNPLSGGINEYLSMLSRAEVK